MDPAAAQISGGAGAATQPNVQPSTSTTAQAQPAASDAALAPVVVAQEPAAIDPQVWNSNNGDFITHPQYKKVSQAFRFNTMMDDSDCSEDYDGDMFFEGAQLAPYPALSQTDVMNAERSQQLQMHPNQAFAQMDQSQQQMLLRQQGNNAAFASMAAQQHNQVPASNPEMPADAFQSERMLNDETKDSATSVLMHAAANLAADALVKSALQVETEVDMYPKEKSLRAKMQADEIERQTRPQKDSIQQQEYPFYFNYELRPSTWNLLVNKQIYMRFERLLIDKQLGEVHRKETALKDELRHLQMALANVQNDRKRLKDEDIRAKVEKSEAARSNGGFGGSRDGPQRSRYDHRGDYQHGDSRYRGRHDKERFGNRFDNNGHDQYHNNGGGSYRNSRDNYHNDGGNSYHRGGKSRAYDDQSNEDGNRGGGRNNERYHREDREKGRGDKHEGRYSGGRRGDYDRDGGGSGRDKHYQSRGFHEKDRSRGDRDHHDRKGGADDYNGSRSGKYSQHERSGDRRNGGGRN